MQVAFCIALLILGSSTAVYLVNFREFVESVGAIKATSATLKRPIGEQMVAALGFALVGLTIQLRRAIWRTLRGEIRPRRTDEVQKRNLTRHTFTFILPMISAQFACYAGLVLHRGFSDGPAGWMILGVLTLASGYGAGKASAAFLDYLYRRRAADTEEILDTATISLFYATTLLFLFLHTDEYLDRRARLIARKQAYYAALDIELNGTPLKYTSAGEKELRRSIKMTHARIAARIREHAEALAGAHSKEDYKKICDSMLGGFLAALEGNMEALLKTAPQITRLSRLSKIARHVAPAAVMAAFAGIIPLLPGAGDAAGSVRVLLLATAALTLIPGSSSARATVEGALNKAIPGPQKP
jgi:hypothetical protein